jgi:hypothetical protein
VGATQQPSSCLDELLRPHQQRAAQGQVRVLPRKLDEIAVFEERREAVLKFARKTAATL